MQSGGQGLMRDVWVRAVQLHEHGGNAGMDFQADMIQLPGTTPVSCDQHAIG